MLLVFFSCLCKYLKLKLMNKIIKLIFITSFTMLLSACWHEADTVKNEQTVLTPAPALIETDIAPHNSK